MFPWTNKKYLARYIAPDITSLSTESMTIFPIFPISPQRRILWYSLEVLCWGISKEYLKHKELLCGYLLLSRAIRIRLISKACCFKIICFEDAKIYFQWKIRKIFHILSSVIIRQTLKTSMRVISKCTSINQKSVYCGFNILISAELPFILRADPTSILLAFSVFRLTHCTASLLSFNTWSESSAPKMP